MKNPFKDLHFNSRWLQRLILPLCIYNTINSYILVRKESAILKSVINDNNDFFSALGHIGFRPFGRFGQLTTEMPYEKGLTIEQINEIANKTIIGVVMRWVEGENLFGVIFCNCQLDGESVRATISPSNLPVLVRDSTDLLIASAFVAMLTALGFIYV